MLLPKLWCNIILFSSILIYVKSQNTTRFHVIYEWNYINFTWPSEEVFRSAEATGSYIPENIHISGIKYFEDYLYITVPRMKNGVPATLTRIPHNTSNTNTAPLLEPFPSWEMNTLGDCNALQNIQNVEIDPKGYMYILDVGKTNTISKTPNNNCQPRLVIYDIKSNQIITNYIFPKEVTNTGSFLYDLVVDDVDGGYLYIADNSGIDPGIIVYSMKLGRSWILRDETMKAKPEAIDFVVNGTAVSAAINIAGIALGPSASVVQNNHEIVIQDRMVYYCPLSSYRLYSISSSILRDEKYAEIGIANFVNDLGRKASQSDGIVMDENGVLYYGLLADSSIARWDSKEAPFASGQKVITRDRTFIQWPDSIAFDMSGNLFIVTNKLQKLIYGKMDIQQPNFRILRGHVGTRSYLYSVGEKYRYFKNGTNDEEYEETKTSPEFYEEGSNLSTSSIKPIMENNEKPGNMYYNTDDTQRPTSTLNNSQSTTMMDDGTIIEKITDAAHLTRVQLSTLYFTLLLLIVLNK